MFFFGLFFLHFACLPVSGDVLTDLNKFWQSLYEQGKNITDTEQPILPVELLAKAMTDECFFGMFTPDPDHPEIVEPENPNVYDPEQTKDCDHNKVNQAYVWGMAKSGDNIWFGTGPNVNCLVQASYLGLEDYTQENDAYVCEFGYSQYLRSLQAELAQVGYDIDISELPLDLIGDWRPPRIFVYNTITKILSEKTPIIPTRKPLPTRPLVSDRLVPWEMWSSWVAPQPLAVLTCMPLIRPRATILGQPT